MEHHEQHMKSPNIEFSRMYFLEKPAYKRGQEIITVRIATLEGKQKPVAHIYLDFHKENKRPVYISCDAKGNEIFPQTQDIHELKKQFKEHERELSLKMETQEKSRSMER